MHVVRRVTRGWQFGFLASGIAAAAALAGAAAPTAAAAATHHHVVAIDITSSEVAVTTSTGHPVLLDLHAYAKPHAVEGNELDVDMAQLNGAGGANGEEDHSWMFPIETNALTAQPSGNGALTVKSATLGGFGVLKLTITPTSKPTTQRCGGAAAASVSRVKLAGTLLFKTQSTGANKWGSIGSANVKKVFKFPGHSKLTQYYAGGEKCLYGGSALPSPPCASSVQWDSGGLDVDLSGYELPGANIVEGTRFTLLHRPYGAARIDDVVSTVPRPTFLTAPDQTVTTSLNAMLGVVGQAPASTGKALLLSSKAAAAQTVPCGSHGKTVKVTMWQASYKNAVTPLTLNADIFGAMRDKDNSEAMLLTTGTATTPTPTPTPTPTVSPTAAIAHVSSAQAALAQVEQYARAQRLARFRG
jgi:hypothetical protein